MTLTKRCPIVAVLGHVDSGKTSLLDTIRSTSVGAKEAAHITQHVGASEIPIDKIKDVCGKLFDSIGKVSLPGILTIDTPGHEAFTSLRERGGSIADIAILVIDIKAGIQPQTKEAIEILKSFKVPFVIALNKVDTLPFWNKTNQNCIFDSLKQQGDQTKQILDEKLYTIVGELSQFGFSSERFDRVDDYTKEVVIVPTSAQTGEGTSELLMVITGLAQKFLDEKLEFHKESNAKGTVLEVKDTKGWGKTIDVILYDGIAHKDDYIVIVGKDKPIVTKIKTIMKPAPLSEIREKSTKFSKVNEVHAAAGVKICATGLEEVMPGMPIEATKDKNKVDEIVGRFKNQIAKITLTEEEAGIIIKADTLGSLEALIKLLKQHNIPVSYAHIGDLTQNDVKLAKNMGEKNEFFSCIFSFHVKIPQEVEKLVKNNNVKLIEGNIIYRLIDEYNDWKKEVTQIRQDQEMQKVVLPAKITVLPGFLFRQSKPCIVGVEVLEGKIKNGFTIMDKSENVIGKIVNIQDSGKSVGEASKGDRVAVSIDGGNFSKNINENDIFYTNIDKNDYKVIKTKLKTLLSEDQKQAMKEILEIRKKKDPFWGG